MMIQMDRNEHGVSDVLPEWCKQVEHLDLILILILVLITAVAVTLPPLNASSLRVIL